MDGNQLRAYLDMAGLDHSLYRDVSAPLDRMMIHEEIINSESELMREQIARAIDDMAQIDMNGLSQTE